MKKTLLLLVLFFLSNSFVYADKPKIYCEILSTDTVISIQSHLFWNVGFDENISIPNSFISGDDESFIKRFRLGKNNLEVKLFFPKQENGRNLNTTTTVFLTIYLNGEKIIYTEHFGQHSDEFVAYDTDILPRPSIITLFLDEEENVRVNILGDYTPKSSQYRYLLDDESFSLQYSPSLGFLDDVKIYEDVVQYGPEPKTLNQAEEYLNIGSLNNPATYFFTADIGEYANDGSYTWGLYSFLFCTEKASESKLTSLFRGFLPEYSSYKHQSTIRVFDPEITYYSSDIRINPKNIVQTGNNTYKLTNLTNDYILSNGVTILNKINQKVITISFLQHLVESVEVGENTTYKLDEDRLYIYGDGLSRLNYSIYVRKKDN